MEMFEILFELFSSRSTADKNKSETGEFNRNKSLVEAA